LPTLSQADVRKQIAAGKVGPLYLIVGSDETGRMGLAGEFLELVEPDLRPFNVDRLYGGEASAADVVDAARTLPMMVPRRVVLLVHAERLLNPKKDPKKDSKKDAKTDAEAHLQVLEDYVKSPVDSCCLVLVADVVDKRRSLARQLLAKATLVDCSGPGDVVEAAKWVKERVAKEGLAIDPRVARLVADRIWPDVSRLRSDVERLMLYAAGNKAITEADVQEVVAAAATPDDWGVTNAIERGSARDALRELGLMMDNGTVPYLILGQLAWFVRTKVPAPKVSSAIDAVFRTDLAIKTSAGEPRALLERLVVELCAR
jgi:DNA polymerase-3 subunit delta